MNCADKFVITKGVDNTFVFTIKQNGSTLPMEIVDNQITKFTSITPTVTYVPYQPEVKYVPAKAEVQASPGQEYIPSVEGKVEKYSVYANALVSGTTYELQINSTTISVPYNSNTYSDKYEYLIAIKNAINTSAVKTIVVATVDSNILKIEGLTEGQSYTVNGSNTFTITETQTAQTAVAGQPYVAPVEYSPAVDEVPYSAEVDPHYLATNDTISVDISELVNGLTVAKIEVQPETSVSKIAVGVDTIQLVNNWYDIGTASEFMVTPVANTDKLEDVLPDIRLKLRITLIDTVDKFTAKLVKLETGELELEVDEAPTANGSKLEIKDAENGNIELTLAKEDLTALDADRGPKVDRYYLRPNYSLIVYCDTFNNGKFSAKIPYVYVE
jgi:hypothetical protein